MLNFYLWTLGTTWGLWAMGEIRCKHLIKKYGIPQPKTDIYEKIFNKFKTIMFNSTPLINMFWCVVYFALCFLISDKEMEKLIKKALKKIEEDRK